MDFNQNEKLDYTIILLSHLNRISFVTTSNFIEGVPKELAEKFINPPSLGQLSLDWATNYLSAIIPDDLQDKTFKEELDKLGLNDRSSKYNFARLHIIVNLLNRKGLLLSNNISIRRGPINKKKADFEPTEVFDD